MSPLLEEFTLRAIVLTVLGEAGRRILNNRTKTNQQLLTDYLDLINLTHSTSYVGEARRLLGKFFDFLGELPPSTDLAIRFLGQYQDRATNTKIRYTFMLSAFFRWYSGDKLPTARPPRILPQLVPYQDFEKLLNSIYNRKTHKRKALRDALLVETGLYTGLRAGELSRLNFEDLNFEGEGPTVIVRGGKGGKDRAVPLIPYLRDKLSDFTRGMKPGDGVFGLTRKSISMKISGWARKAGVPHIHAHSMRHFTGTTLAERGASVRMIQEILGHEDPKVTMGYLQITGRGLSEAMNLLDPNLQKKAKAPLDDAWVQPVSYGEPPDKDKRKEPETGNRRGNQES